MRTIFLSPEIKKLFINIMKGDAYFTRVFLLGSTRFSTVKKAVRLSIAGGCDGMPSIGEREIAEAYLEIAKEGLIPNGITRIGRHIGTTGRWHCDCGSAIFYNSGMVFIGINHPNPVYWRAEEQPINQKYWETKRVEIKMRKI